MSGLIIPEKMGVGAVSVGEEEQRDLSSHWMTSASVEAQVASWGFKALSCPSTTCPVLTPQELTTDDTRHYTEMYARLNEWNHYASNVLARIEAREKEIKNELDQLQRSIKDETIKAAKQAKEKKPSNAVLEELAKAHPRYIHLLHVQQQTEQQKLLMKSHTKRLDNDLKLISRQVTIRQGDIDNRTKGHNIPHRSPGLAAPNQGPYGQ